MSESGNDATSTQPTGRRARNRIARHEQLLSAAAEIVSSEGLDGLTMQAVAERVDCAVGTIYTYFDSKSSLLTALQIAAIETLGTSFRRSRAQWEELLVDSDLDEPTRALVRLVAFGHLFTDAPSLHPREFELLQVLLSTRRRETSDEDAGRVLPYALGLINEFRILIEAAVESGALESDDPDGSIGDHSLSRTVRWAGALNGALLVSNAAAVPSESESPAELSGTGAPVTVAGGVFDGRVLARQLAADLLAGWGAERERLAAATAIVDELRATNRLAVPGDPLVEPATHDNDRGAHGADNHHHDGGDDGGSDDEDDDVAADIRSVSATAGAAHGRRSEA